MHSREGRRNYRLDVETFGKKSIQERANENHSRRVMQLE